MKHNSQSDILKEELEKRQRKNPAYSLRSLAQALDMKPGTLSNIMAGKRNIPKSKLSDVVARLALPPQKAYKLLQKQKNGLRELSNLKLQEKDQLVLDESYHRVLSEWEHFAVLSLMETHNFQSEPNWIAIRLGISKLHSEQVLKRLEQVKLISFKKKTWIRNFESLTTSEDIVSAALQASHKENMEIAIRKLQNVPPAARDYSSITMAINPEKLPEAKALVREFRKKLSAFLEDGERSDVYRLSIELFPLTENLKK